MNPKEMKFNMDDVKENIVFNLINTNQNQQVLKDKPNRQFLDLSIVYRWIMSCEDGITSIPIDNSFMETVGLSENELFELAIKNTQRILPPTTRTMEDVLRTMLMENGMSSEMVDEMIGDTLGPALWIIGNEKNAYGAIAMLYEENLKNLAEKMESDLLIMPSSIHEVIVASSRDYCPQELVPLVEQVNAEEVSLDEQLSNHVYLYIRNTRKISLAL